MNVTALGQQFIYSLSHFIFSMSFCRKRKWDNYFRDEETQLHKVWFVPKTQSSWRLWQDVNSGFMIQDAPSKVVFIYTKSSVLSKVLMAPQVSNGAPETYMHEKLPDSDKEGDGFYEDTKEGERERDSEKRNHYGWRQSVKFPGKQGSWTVLKRRANENEPTNRQFQNHPEARQKYTFSHTMLSDPLDHHLWEWGAPSDSSTGQTWKELLESSDRTS